jgi:hypothetical protein
MQAFQDYKKATANQLKMTVGDKRKLIDDIADALDIGGWTEHNNYDVNDEDVICAWAEVETAAATANSFDLDAYRVALLVATRWEASCHGLHLQ